MGDPQESARERQRERAETVEHVLERAKLDLSGFEYPVTSEELAAEYGGRELDLPNETETFGDVVDRLTEDRFDSEREVREAVLNQVSGAAGGDAEYDDERRLE